MLLFFHDLGDQGPFGPRVQGRLEAVVPGLLNSAVAADSLQGGIAPSVYHRLITIRVGHHVEMGTHTSPYKLGPNVLARHVGLSVCRAREEP